MTLPLWKITRELKRAKMQFSQIYWFLFGERIKRQYDKERSQKIKRHEGKQTLARDIAIILIYQSNGIQNSLIEQIEHLNRKGVSSVVCSNAPLSENDRGRLVEISYLTIERPNYGYDFGGYRDAVLTLLDRGIAIENLFILNDSIWYPVFEHDDLIEQSRSNHSDMFGIYFNDHPTRPASSHIQSYFFRFSAKLVTSDAFRKIWQDLRMTNNKHMVVRQCEMKLTNLIKSAGFSIGYMFDRQLVEKTIRDLPEDELLGLLDYYTFVDTKLSDRIQKANIDFSASDWRDQMEGRGIIARIAKYFMISHPDVLFGVLKVPVLKKDRQPMYQRQRAEFLQTRERYRPNPTIISEIEGWDSRR